MPLIHILDEPTINQIAAGEVVERPSAVVKELIENAMDAGATAITAEIKEGGLSFIRITDNGQGIAREDIPLAFLRHATSKIRSAEDLLSVTSLGFRGEALSSIAAVSQLELITKTPSALNGYRYIMEGGEEKSLEEIGCPAGTTIIVRNLFYNTPARRKFLKSAMTEAGYISDLMERLMVSHPGVSFKFILNNQVKLQSSGNNICKDILYHVYGRDITREILSVELISPELKITGFVGKPIITRGNRNYENYFINGRYIKSNVITKAIEEAYKPYMMQHKYPFTSLYFEIDPSMIDVNVHPQKMEIRLKNAEEIYQITCQTIREVLSGKELIPRVRLTSDREDKKDDIRIPEPFEENRRKQLGIYTNHLSIENKVAEDNQYKINQNNSINGNNVKDIQAEAKGIVKSLAIGNLEGSNNNKIDSPDININKYNRSADIQITDNQSIGNRSTDTRITNNQSTGIQSADNQIADNQSIGNRSTDNQITDNQSTSIQSTNNYKTDNFEIDALTINYQSTNNQPMKTHTMSHQLIDNKLTDESKLNVNHIDDNKLTDESEFNVNHTDDNKLTIETNHDNELPAGNTIIPVSQPQIVVSEQMNLFHEDEMQPEAPFLSKKALEEHRIIGQIFSTYWLVEYKKELYIIDQHAAHEKVLYEKILLSAKVKEYTSQQLMPPIVLTLSLREQEVIKKYEETLKSLGYEFENFGGNEYSVRSVPADLYGISEKELLLEFIDELAEEISVNVAGASSILERIASLSCKAAVKANHNLSNEEAQVLIKELLTLENPYNCPHGRPVIISMSQYELERKFKRII